MKTLISTLFLLLGVLIGFAQDAVDPFVVVEFKEGSEEKAATPATLAEAHAQLEKQLSETDLKKIDAMKSEDQMIECHFGSGMGMRNSWGLQGDSSLETHMRGLGFIHADDMSEVILETFWCKRHAKDFRIKERVEYYKAYWAENKWPDKNAVDPEDKSEVDWSRGYEAEGRLHRTIYIGRSKDSGRLLAFENPKGVYVPDKKLIESLRKNEARYTQRITSGTEVDPLPELESESGPGD